MQIQLRVVRLPILYFLCVAVPGGRGRGRGRGGREVHLCGAPSGLPLPWFCEWKHLQMCSGGGRGGVTEIQCGQYNILYCTGRQVGNTSRQNTVTCSTATYTVLPVLGARGEGRDSNPRLPLSSSWG